MGPAIIGFSTYTPKPYSYPHGFPQASPVFVYTYPQSCGEVCLVIDTQIKKPYTFPRLILITTAGITI